MMNFFHNMNLIPKNFIVAGIVDTLKADPEAGAQKVFDMADKFVSDEAMSSLVEEAKNAYYTRSSIRMYVKNLIYNTQKSPLNHFLNNLVVKHLMEGISLRQEAGLKLNKEIPHTFILNVGQGKKKLAEKDFHRAVFEAKELGIHFIIVAGLGLAHPEFWSVCEKNSDVQFLVFCKVEETGPAVCERMEKYANIIPLIMSRDGEDLDISHIKAAGILFGVLTKTTSENFQQVTSDAYVLPFIRQGSRISFYVTSKKDAIKEEEILRIKHRVDNIRQIRPYVTLHLESENNDFGGGLYFEELINEKLIKVKIPEVGLEIGKKALKDLF